MNIKECDLLVSILNMQVEQLGYNVDEEGFGYDDECVISCANGDSFQEGLQWLWSESIKDS